MATTWLVRKTGADANGGTSPSVRSTGTDGATNVGNNTLTAASAAWTSADIGHGINIASNWRLITAVASGTSLTYSGSPIATATGRTWTVGGSFLTWGKGAGLVAAGDSLYLGAGVYREAVSLTTAGSAGNVISVVGDVDGVITGDPGDVRLTGYLTNDTNATTGIPLTINGKGFYTFDSLLIDSGSQRVVDSHTTAAANLTFRRCLLQNTSANSGNWVAEFLAAADVALNLTIDRCIIVANSSAPDSIQIDATLSASADYNLNAEIRNCFILAQDRGGAFSLISAGAGAFKGGGVTIENCTFWTPGAITAGASVSGQYPVVVQNCVVFGPDTLFSANAATLGGIVEDFNKFFSFSPRSNVTAGPNSNALVTFANLYEFGQSYLWGRNPRPFLAPSAGSPALGFGNTTIAVGIPATAADDATVGTISWGTPNNSKYPNDSNVATAALTAGTTSHYLKVTNFGLAIPAGATITQIRVEIVMNKNAGTGLLAGTGNSCRLTKDGTTFIGNDYGTSLPVPTTTNTISSVGSANDLWGLSWAPADLNSANFGVGISFKETGGSNAVTPQVDYVRVVVNYTPTSLPTAQTQDLTGGPRPAGGAATNAVGAFERGNTAVRETSTTHTGSNALKLAGPGYQDKFLDVDAVSTVVSVYLRYDSSYGGATLPTLSVLNGTECGVAAATASQVGAANTWEKVSLTLVPTGKGRVTLRVTNLSTAAAGNVYADTWGVA